MPATFRFDAATLKTIQDLKAKFGVSTDEEVIQKAITLAKLAGDSSDGDSNPTIGDRCINLRK